MKNISSVDDSNQFYKIDKDILTSYSIGGLLYLGKPHHFKIHENEHGILISFGVFINYHDGLYLFSH